MFSPADWTLELNYDNQQIKHPLGMPLRTDALFIDFNWNPIADAEAAQLQLTIHPKQSIRLKKVRISCPFQYKKQHRVFANGYQSWSESGEYSPDKGIAPLRKIARPLFKFYGDDWIPGIQRGKGYLHSWTFSYIRDSHPEILFLASLNESSCFTRIIHDSKNQSLSLELDMEELELTHSYPALEILLFKGELIQAMNRWRNMMDFPTRKRKHLWAWNSWYRFFRDIDPDVLIQEASAIPHSFNKIEWFQIDDGYQKETGDWLKPKPAFDKKLGALAREIKKIGLKPGLWIAPFVCSRKSEIFKKHPDWILKDKKGKNIRVGYNPMWGGWYYALNPYHPGLREYLTGVFHVYINQMGYEFLKLDFLFTAALAPPPGKTRGQVMHESMAFLKYLAGPKTKLLACGVPLASAFGQTDFCRIGPDIHLKWDHKILKFLNKRERVSTINALKTNLGRWMLNGHFFDNDPDVFILRKEGNQLTEAQQKLLFQLNILLGNIHFTSDNLSNYPEETWALFEEMKQFETAKIKDIQSIKEGNYIIHYQLQGKTQKMKIDLLNAEINIEQK